MLQLRTGTLLCRYLLMLLIIGSFVTVMSPFFCAPKAKSQGIYSFQFPQSRDLDCLTPKVYPPDTSPSSFLAPFYFKQAHLLQIPSVTPGHFSNSWTVSSHQHLHASCCLLTQAAVVHEAYVVELNYSVNSMEGKIWKISHP